MSDAIFATETAMPATTRSIASCPAAIMAAANYPCEDAWPGRRRSGLQPHIRSDLLDALAGPTGITIYDGAAIPEWQGDLFMCSFKDSTTAVHHFKLNAGRTAIVSHTILTDTVTHQRLKCRTDLLPGPDGALYFSEGGGWLNGPIKR